jgi:hypothetical protein
MADTDACGLPTFTGVHKPRFLRDLRSMLVNALVLDSLGLFTKSADTRIERRMLVKLRPMQPPAVAPRPIFLSLFAL